MLWGRITRVGSLDKPGSGDLCFWNVRCESSSEVFGESPDYESRRKGCRLAAVTEAESSFDEENSGLSGNVCVPPKGIGAIWNKGYDGLGISCRLLSVSFGRPVLGLPSVGRIEKDWSGPGQGESVIFSGEVRPIFDSGQSGKRDVFWSFSPVELLGHTDSLVIAGIDCGPRPRHLQVKATFSQGRLSHGHHGVLPCLVFSVSLNQL
jgi:hypothetical protein